MSPDHLWAGARTRVYSSWPSPGLPRTTKKVTGVDDQERAGGDDVEGSGLRDAEGFGWELLGQIGAGRTGARHAQLQPSISARIAAGRDLRRKSFHTGPKPPCGRVSCLLFMVAVYFLDELTQVAENRSRASRCVLE